MAQTDETQTAIDEIEDETDEYFDDVIVDAVLNPMIKSILGEDGQNLETADLSKGAEEFLSSAGMSGNEIESVRDLITGNP